RVENVGGADQTVLTIKFGDRTPNAGLDHDLDDAQVFRNPLAEPRPDNLTSEPRLLKKHSTPMNENLTEKPKKPLFESDKNEDPSIVVTDSEHAVGHFELQYDSVRDQYRRPFDPQIVQPIEKYETLAAQRGGVFRKVEPEWRAFLASKMAGALRYTILHSGARVKSAEARMNGVATFRQGAIGAQLKSGDKTDMIPLENAPFLAEQQGDRVWGLNREPVVEKMRVDDVGDADKTTLVIFFNDKTENEQLDHDLDDAQVFRTPLDKPEPENLVIHIEFMPQQMPENLEKLEKPTPEVESTAEDFGKFHMTIMERYTIVTIIRNKFGLDPANTLRDRFGSSYERKIVYINFDKTGREAQNQSIEEKAAPEVNAVADALGGRQLLTQLSLFSPINRYRIVQLVRVKYGIELADALKKQLIGFDQLINLLLISQLERISSVYEEQQITKQMAQLTSASDYKLVSSLRATPDELNSAQFSGDALEAMNAIVQYARNPAQYFADRFNDQNERDLIRLVVTRAESGDLPVISAEFKRIYGLPLTALIISDSKAATKQILANLAKAYGGGNAQ
uniref:PAW domain-containing protein n=1 Tax=Globodera pallida TaxID=36090 RepID=A0A183CPD4_GLOPA